MIDETVKALRGECKALCKDGLGKNCLGCEYIGEELMHPYYRCNLQSIAADQLEQLQAENERLKASQPVMCGEVASHSEKEIVSGCITLMERLKNKFGEYLDFVGFEPECEEERFSVGFHYNEIIRTLLLSGTSHSGGTSTAQKCKELGFDYSKIIEFDFEEGTE